MIGSDGQIKKEEEGKSWEFLKFVVDFKKNGPLFKTNELDFYAY